MNSCVYEFTNMNSYMSSYLYRFMSMNSWFCPVFSYTNKLVSMIHLAHEIIHEFGVPKVPDAGPRGRPQTPPPEYSDGGEASSGRGCDPRRIPAQRHAGAACLKLHVLNRTRGPRNLPFAPAAPPPTRARTAGREPASIRVTRSGDLNLEPEASACAHPSPGPFQRWPEATRTRLGGSVTDGTRRGVRVAEHSLSRRHSLRLASGPQL